MTFYPLIVLIYLQVQQVVQNAPLWVFVSQRVQGGAIPVKHVNRLSRRVTRNPRQADQVQDFICTFATILNDLNEAIGGTNPILGYVVDKCDLPEPERD